MKDRFTSVTFKNYKALKKYSLSLNEFNVLVGPNNAGKSTIIGAFKILYEGMRKASARKAQYIGAAGVSAWGYNIPLDDIPVAIDNIFTDYDDSEPAIIEFRLSSGNSCDWCFRKTAFATLYAILKESLSGRHLSLGLLIRLLLGLCQCSVRWSMMSHFTNKRLPGKHCSRTGHRETFEIFGIITRKILTNSGRCCVQLGLEWMSIGQR